MSATRVFVARLVGCGVFDPLGDRVGKVVDVVMAYRKNQAPRAKGFVIEISGRRRVFLPMARVTVITAGNPSGTIATAIDRDTSSRLSSC